MCALCVRNLWGPSAKHSCIFEAKRVFKLESTCSNAVPPKM